MTVAELIEQLKKAPGDMRVVVQASEDSYHETGYTDVEEFYMSEQEPTVFMIQVGDQIETD